MFRIAVTIYAALGFLACSSATSPHKVTVTLSGAPYGLAVSPSGVVYVTLASTGMIARADLPATSFSPVAVVGSVPTAVTFNASGTRAYVTNQFSRTVSVLDPASNTILHVIPVTGDPFGVRVAPGDSVLWVTTNADSVYALRLSTDSVVAVFPTGSASNGVVLADTFAYVSTLSSGTVIEINTRSYTVSRVFNVGGTPQELVLSPDGAVLYIANESGAVQFWDLATGTSAGLVVLPGGGGFGLARNPANGRLYVSTSYFGRAVHEIDPVTRAIVRTIATDGSPRRIAFDATGSLALVTNESGWIDVIR